MISRIQSNDMEKTLLECNKDRLSDLPNVLLIQILSLLEMKDAIKTSALSKRWNLLWTHVYNIVYKCYIMYDRSQIDREEFYKQRDKKMRGYISFIDRTLPRCVFSIKKFSLTGFRWFGISYLGMADVIWMSKMMDDWITYVLEKKVEVLKLDLDGLCAGVRSSLYQCSSVKELNLSAACIMDEQVSWPCVKSLCLQRSLIEDEQLENVLLGCPVLESLVLKKVSGLHRLDITSLSVKRLKLYVVYGILHDILEIRAPFIQELEISGNLSLKHCVVVDVSSLVKATLTFTIYLPPTSTYYAEPSSDDEPSTDDDLEELARIDMEQQHVRGLTRMLIELLEAFCHVGELLIGSEILQVLSLPWPLDKAFLSFKCKHLTISSPLWKYDISGLLDLLVRTPQLESLVVNVSSPQKNKPFPQVEEISSAHQFKRFRKGNFMHLKNIKFCYDRNPLTEMPNITKLMESALTSNFYNTY